MFFLYKLYHIGWLFCKCLHEMKKHCDEKQKTNITVFMLISCKWPPLLIKPGYKKTRFSFRAITSDAIFSCYVKAYTCFRILQLSASLAAQDVVCFTVLVVYWEEIDPVSRLKLEVRHARYHPSRPICNFAPKRGLYRTCIVTTQTAFISGYRLYFHLLFIQL